MSSPLHDGSLACCCTDRTSSHHADAEFTEACQAGDVARVHKKLAQRLAQRDTLSTKATIALSEALTEDLIMCLRVLAPTLPNTVLSELLLYVWVRVCAECRES